MNGTVTFIVPATAPNTLYYNCEFHAVITNAFTIIDYSDPHKFKIPENFSLRDFFINKVFSNCIQEHLNQNKV